VLLIYGEGAKARDLDPATVAQALANNREDRFDHFAGFLFRRTDALADQVHEIGFGHALRRIGPRGGLAALTCAMLRALSRCVVCSDREKKAEAEPIGLRMLPHLLFFMIDP
jgi:hypothetical protein